MIKAPISPTGKSPRYVFLDAWRAIAALGVMMHHMIHNTVMTATLKNALPAPLMALDQIASYRIPLFMIISGFVIAHALRKNPLTKASIGNFVLRRHLRLDPVYWVMIILMLGFLGLEKLIPGTVTPRWPNSKDVLLNFVYLQNILHAEEVVGVAWTLCIEFQFYMIFVLMLVLGKLISRRRIEGRSHAEPLWMAFGLGCVSLGYIHFVDNNVWFIQYWHYFALGTLCWAAVHFPQFQKMFYYFLGLTALSMIFMPLSPLVPHLSMGDPNVSAPAMLISLLLSGFIYIVGIRGRLATMWNWRPLQYVGSISYSLYLVHIPVLWVVLRGGYKLTRDNPYFAVMWFVIAGLACVGVAHVFFLMFERPSMKFAARFKPRSEAPVALPNSQVEQELLARLEAQQNASQTAPQTAPVTSSGS